MGTKRTSPVWLGFGVVFENAVQRSKKKLESKCAAQLSSSVIVLLTSCLCIARVWRFVNSVGADTNYSNRSGRKLTRSFQERRLVLVFPLHFVADRQSQLMFQTQGAGFVISSFSARITLASSTCSVARKSFTASSSRTRTPVRELFLTNVSGLLSCMIRLRL